MQTSSPSTSPSPSLKPFDSARFVLSVAQLAELNKADLALLPEVAFVGRSNAGKSTAVNALTNQKRLAFASKTPGRTQLLNFFEISSRDAQQITPLAYLVDLPGYGFAKVDARTRVSWDELAGMYLQARRMLRGVVVVMDSRRPLLPADEDLLAWLAQRDDAAQLRIHLLLTKADQLTQSERRAALNKAEQRAEDLPFPTSVQLMSALKNQGIDELRDATRDMLGIIAGASRA